MSSAQSLIDINIFIVTGWIDEDVKSGVRNLDLAARGAMVRRE